MTLAALISALDAWCPFGTAYAWDNVGLQVGDPASLVRGGLVALDLTHAVLDEAGSQGANVVVTHHPLIFKPLKRVTAGPGPAGLAYRCAAEGIAHVALHTNLDVAHGGVSFALAAQLGLTNVRGLQPLEGATVKLVTFVPEAHEAAVREAMGAAGAGRIGHYSDCAFGTAGTGYFRPDEAATPFTGTPAGTLEAAVEVRLEVEVARVRLPGVMAALRAAHPYEELAYDVVPVEQPSTLYSLGAVGELPASEAGAAFLARVAGALGEDALHYAGDLGRPVRRVAVCGGSGSDLVPLALRAGADAFVTADVTYHRFFDVLDGSGAPALLYVNARHDATERCAETLLLDACRALAPQCSWQRTEGPTSPAQVWVRPVS